MATPTLTRAEFDRAAHILRTNSKPKEILKTIFRNTIQNTTGGFTLFTISFLYFWFTGMAILFGRKIPRGWLNIAIKLEKGKLAEKIEPEKKKNFKVVDLETHENLPLS